MRSAPILLVVLLDMLGFGLIMPLLPFAAQSFGASTIEMGLMSAMFPLCQTTTGTLWGSLSDRIGRRPVLFVSALGSVAAYLLFAMASSYSMLLVARALAGIMAANLGVARAYLVDVSDEASLPKAMGLYGAAQGLGFLLGPAIGAVLAGGVRAPGLAAAGLSLCSAILVVLIAEPRQLHARKSSTPTRQLLARHPLLLPVCAVFFLITLSFSHVFIAFPIRLQEAHGYGARESAYFFIVLSVVAVLVQGFAFAKLAKRAPETLWLTIGLVVTTVSLASFSAFSALWATIALTVFGGLGFSLSSAAVLSLIAKSVDSEVQGFAAGLSEALSGFGRALGPLVAGVALSYGASYPAFVSSAAFAGLAIVIAAKDKRARDAQRRIVASAEINA